MYEGHKFMKYIFTNDANLIMNKYKKTFLFYIVLLLLYLWVNVTDQIDIDLFLSALGLNCTLDSNLLSLIMYILNIYIMVMIPLILLINDLDHMENIFLRMKLKKWMIFKTMSILLITFIYRILIYILISFFNKNYMILSYFVHDYLFSVTIQMFFILFYLIVHKNKKILPIIIVLLIFNFKYLILDVININNYLLYALPIISFILLMVISKKKYIL